MVGLLTTLRVTWTIHDLYRKDEEEYLHRLLDAKLNEEILKTIKENSDKFLLFGEVETNHSCGEVTKTIEVFECRIKVDGCFKAYT